MQYDLGMSLSNNIRLGNIYPLGSVFLLYFIIGRNWNGFVYCIVWPGCQCPPVSISNGNFTYKALNRSECGAVVTFICDPGYLLNGSVTVVCRNYSWSPPLPNCESRNMIFYTEYTIIIINLEWISKNVNSNFENFVMLHNTFVRFVGQCLFQVIIFGPSLGNGVVLK